MRGIRVLLAVSLANLVVAAVHFGLAAAAPLLRDIFHLDAAQLGLLLAAPPLGLMLGTFAWGELADRSSERGVLIAAFLGFSLASAAGAWAASDARPLAYGLLLLAAGVCGSAAHSAGGRAIAAAFAPERQGLVLAIRHTAIPLGAALGGLAVPLLTAGWGLGVASAAGAALGLLVVAGIMAAIPGQRGAVPSGAGADVFTSGSPLRVRALWLLASGGAGLAFVQLGIGSFLTVQLVDETGLQMAKAAAIFTAAQLLGAAGRIVLGAWSDRIANRVWILRGVAAVAGAALLLAAVATRPAIEATALIVALVVVTSCNGVVVATAASLAPTGRTGATLGMQTTFNAAACTIAPIMLGAVLAATSWLVFELVLVGVVTAAGACLLALRR